MIHVQYTYHDGKHECILCGFTDQQGFITGDCPVNPGLIPTPLWVEANSLSADDRRTCLVMTKTISRVLENGRLDPNLDPFNGAVYGVLRKLLNRSGWDIVCVATDLIGADNGPRIGSSWVLVELDRFELLSVRLGQLSITVDKMFDRLGGPST